MGGYVINVVGGYVINVLNIKGKYRVSTNYRCCPAGTPSDITDIAVYRNMRYQFSSGTVIEDRLIKP
ncbi:MAG: ectoine hydroxylase [Paraglaciecola sp.]|jgi:ectoine hydroxylase